MLIDLQLHSAYSDGYLTPSKLAEFIHEKGVKAASLTDHNTVGSFHEFINACKQYKIKVIPGIEIYAKLNSRRLNLLWYNFDHTDPDLHNMLRSTQVRRRAKVRGHLELLVEQGFKIDINSILDKYTHYIPINHVIDDILAVKHNQNKVKKELKEKNIREEMVIKEYFYNSKIGHIMRESYIDIKRVFELRKKVGGQIILNHPGKHRQLKKDLLVKLKELGLDGIEALSPHHSIGAVMYAQALAAELDFISTGGSDFHRFEGGHQHIQSAFDYFSIDSQMLRGIDKIIKNY